MPDYGTVMMPYTVPPLDAIEPDGRVRPPVVALTGPEHTFKTTTVVKTSAHPEIGFTWAVEWGAGDKGILNEYSLMPGARFKLLNHNNSVESVFGQVLAARQTARTALEHGEKPHMLVVDSFSTLWDLIKAWTYYRAAAGLTEKAEAVGKTINPNTELPTGRNLWNDARTRYRQFMNVLLNWPGPVLLTCRADWVSGTNEATGHPTKDRVYSIEAHRSLPRDVTVLIRMNRDAPHVLWKCRSIHYRVDPRENPVEFTDLDLGELMFNKMRYDPHNAPLPDTQERLDSLPAPSRPVVIDQARVPQQQARTTEPTRDVEHRAGAPRPVPRDWEAELATAKSIRNPQQRKHALSELWQTVDLTKAQFPDVHIPPDLVVRIEQAGFEARRQIKELESEAMNGASLEEYHGDSPNGNAQPSADRAGADAGPRNGGVPDGSAAAAASDVAVSMAGERS
jgi:hypothetical protein